jgi:Hemerythrin HHE cation binding domain
MMAIVHRALCRDLERVNDVLTTQPHPQGGQRQALGDHVVWLMHFLHEHHTGQDEGLWPMVRSSNPAAGRLLDALDADHRRIAPAADRLEAAGKTYAATTGGKERTELHAALQALNVELLPHLHREVEEAMPMVYASITHAQWQKWDQDRNVKGKSLAELGYVGHWLIDGIDAEGYQVVVGEVPSPTWMSTSNSSRAAGGHRANTSPGWPVSSTDCSAPDWRADHFLDVVAIPT